MADTVAYIRVVVDKQNDKISHVTDAEFRSYWVSNDLLVDAPVAAGDGKLQKKLEAEEKAHEETREKLEKLQAQVVDLNTKLDGKSDEEEVEEVEEDEADTDTEEKDEEEEAPKDLKDLKSKATLKDKKKGK